MPVEEVVRATPEALRSRFLSEKDSALLKETYPELRKGNYEQWCPTCFKNPDYLWEERPCDCQLQVQLYKHYLRAGIGAAFHRYSWKHLEDNPNKETIESLQKFLDSHEGVVARGLSLFLMGGYGVGKSTVATLMLKRYLWEGYSGYCVPSTMLMNLFADGWYDQGERAKFDRAVKRVQILLLDDLGKQAHNKYWEPMMDMILRHRVQNNLCTIITSNDPPDRVLSPALNSLLEERMMPVSLSGVSFRKKNRDTLWKEAQTGAPLPPIC